MNVKCGTAHTGRFAVLAILFGVITTIFTYSGFGVGDAVEQLLLVFRSLDHAFIPGDVYTNANMDSIVRLHYTHLVTALAGSEHNVPRVFQLLTLYANVAISVVTFFFARDLFKSCNQAGIYASALTMSVTTFGLGWLTTIYQTAAIPAAVAIPLVLGAIWGAYRGHLMASMVLCGVAGLIHPLIGLEIGGLILAMATVGHVLAKGIPPRTFWKKFAPGLLIYACFAVILVLPQLSQTEMDAALFIHILAFFRAPHHYLPSSFGLSRYVYAAAFLGSSLVLFHRVRHARTCSSSLFIALLVVFIVLFCIGGYLFVEIIPSRIWVIAQPFRLLYFVKWIGLILVAGAVADANPLSSTRALYLVGALNPLSLAGGVFSQAFREWLERKRSGWSSLFDPSLVLLLMIIIFWQVSSGRASAMPMVSVVLLCVFTLLILAFGAFSRKALCSTLAAGIALAVIAAFFHGHLQRLAHTPPLRHTAENWSSNYRPEQGPDGDAVASFARQSTPDNSVFLTPPLWCQFRLLARRAIVVDFKTMPWPDAAMQDWYGRVTNCYGMPAGCGFDLVPEFDRHYRALNDDQLHALRDRYRFSHAVLYSSTPTRLKVLFQNETFKVVDLGDGQ
ncbi:MAG: DUF6798 domain-containing protein [Kiritimatiellia bacterium]